MDKNLINKIKNEKINYIVEWWEEDSLDIDNNQHILFSLENEDIDIVITEKNIDEYKYGDAVNKILKFIGVHCLQKRKSF